MRGLRWAGARTPDVNELRASASPRTSARSAARRSACTCRSRRCRSACRRSRPRSARGCSSARRAASRSRPPGGGSTSRPGGCSRRPTQVGEVMASSRRRAVVRLAASHSADGGVRRRRCSRGRPRAARRGAGERELPGRARARGRRPRGRGRRGPRPGHTPNPGVREDELVDDEIVCAVPRGHPWAGRGASSARGSCARRWSSATRRRTRAGRWRRCWPHAGLRAAAPLLEAATPEARSPEARQRTAPVLLCRHIVAATDFSRHGGRPRVPARLRARYAGLRRADRRRPRADRGDPRHVRIWLR